jgi:hypothetical protein
MRESFSHRGVFLVALFGALVGLAGGLCASRLETARAQEARGTVEANRFVLFGPDGAERGSFGFGESGEPELVLMDAKGGTRLRAFLVKGAENPHLELNNAAGTPATIAAVNHEGLGWVRTAVGYEQNDQNKVWSYTEIALNCIFKRD